MPKQFIRVCSLRDLSRRRGRKITFDDGIEVAIFNIDGTLHAVSNVCPHQHESVIADGYIEDCTVTCPLHGNVYNLATGASIVGGAPLKTYEVHIDGDNVMLEKPEPEVPLWMRD